jgi:hypothetical protein
MSLCGLAGYDPRFSQVVTVRDEPAIICDFRFSLEYGIRSLATNSVYVAIKLIDDTRSCQTVEPFTQELLILLTRVGLGECTSLKF